MKKIIITLVLSALAILTLPLETLAAGGIYASGGGNKTVGQTFTITVAASGADFDSLQGTVSVSGPVDIVSFSGTGATWLPGKSPTNGGGFVGICSPTSSLSIISIKLRGKSVGSGSVTVSGAKLARNGIITGTGAGSAAFTIQRAPDMPDSVKVSSTSHPDQAIAYEATKIELAWEREQGVDGYSYLLDQTEGTVPAPKTTSNNTTVSYENQAIGVYYFHIKAHNSDGWGNVTNFKITIKEPDAKINDQLSKPSGIRIEKSSNFVDDPINGTLSGIRISGKTEANYNANIIFDPLITLPEGKSLTAKADANGNFELLLDFPIKAGFYKVTVQGQEDKILTPVSDPVIFEISLAKGGRINILTADDANEPAVVATAKKWYEQIGLNKNMIFYALSGLIIIALIFLGITVGKKLRNRKMARSIKVKES